MSCHVPKLVVVLSFRCIALYDRDPLPFRVLCIDGGNDGRSGHSALSMFDTSNTQVDPVYPCVHKPRSNPIARLAVGFRYAVHLQTFNRCK